MLSEQQLKRVPLYRQAMERIKMDIARKPSGFRIRTEAEYAGEFGISICTVRQAVQELVRAGLIERRHGSGTFVCGELPARKHVGVLLDVDIASEKLSPYYVRWLRQLLTALTEEGIPNRPYLGSLPLGCEVGPRITCQDLVDDVALDRISGIIAWFVHHEWNAPFAKRGIPVLDSNFDRAEGRREALGVVFNHFRNSGRKRVAVIGNEAVTTPSHLRHMIYEVARDCGVELDNRLVDMSASGLEAGMGWERFRDMWRSSNSKPDALFITEEALFNDCQMAIVEMGIRVPEELEVALSTADFLKYPDLRFPVFAWTRLMAPTAQYHAKAMAALLNGEDCPRHPEIFAEVRMLQPDSVEIGTASEFPSAPTPEPV